MKITKLLTMLIALISIFLISCGGTNYDIFAQCLTEQGATFYGAYWCSHCEELKSEFGDSMQYVNYVECSLPNRAGQTEICTREEIIGYPTWKKVDGTEIPSPPAGSSWMQQLSFHVGCPLP
ncbi:TPA: hypothetical protein HA278_03680 [Candidatus Woesearchaeota archaeon]|nr:hypothetical protein [archaeon]HIJ11130.1 hypothetical protein [Candidatus Woesearchaeota archaeon]